MRAACARASSERVDRAPTPRRDRHVGLLGQQLGPDLVAEAAHHLGARADEHDARAARTARRTRAARRRSPTRPTPRRRAPPAAPARARRGRGTGCRRRAAGRRRCTPPRRPRARTSPAARLACTARSCGCRPVLVAELAHGVDEPHRRLAPIDDRDAAEREVHCRRHYVATEASIDAFCRGDAQRTASLRGAVGRNRQLRSAARQRPSSILRSVAPNDPPVLFSAVPRIWVRLFGRHRVNDPVPSSRVGTSRDDEV